MKIVILSLALIIMISSINTQGLTPRGFPRTPKALDLDDHFGTEPVQNVYGPQARLVVADLAREFDTVDGPRYSTPITNLVQEIRPEEQVSGDFTNTSYDASKIIRPEIANPKAEINSTFVHEAIVNTPVHLGTQHTSKLVNTSNRLTGEVSSKEIHSEKPIVGVIKNLRQVTSNKKTFVDIHTGNIINTQKPTFLHGVN
jgi:hypothetical protein